MKLFVANLDYQTTEDDLKRAFELAGYPPFKVKVIYDRDSGESRGYGFVEMHSADDVQGAIGALEGVIVNGRKMAVREAKPQVSREKARVHAHG